MELSESTDALVAIESTETIELTELADEAMETLVGLDRLKGARIIRSAIEKRIAVDSLMPETFEKLPWSGHLGVQLLDQVVDIIRSHASTLVFTNTRSQSEIWYQKILAANPDLAGAIALHHGSISKELRFWVEDALYDGRLKAVVCTSSLDLGVDFRRVEAIVNDAEATELIPAGRDIWPELRTAVGLPAPEPLEAAAPLGELPPQRWLRLNFATVELDHLRGMLLAAADVGYSLTAERVAEALLSREAITDPDRWQALGVLEARARTTTKRLEILTKIRGLAKTMQADEGMLDVAELRIQLQRGDQPAFMQVMERIRRLHGQNPRVANGVAQVLMEAGIDVNALMAQTAGPDGAYYRLFFQEPGTAEADLEADIYSSMRGFLYSISGDALRNGDISEPFDGHFPAGEALTDQFKSVITEAGGSIGKSEYWGIKSLTYRIKKNRKAHFTLMNIDSNSDAQSPTGHSKKPGHGGCGCAESVIQPRQFVL